MGMFDSFYDAAGHEWQTKAFDCLLNVYRVGDVVPDDLAYDTYQVEVLGSVDSRHRDFIKSFATVHDLRVASINDERDTSLPLVDYFGGAS